MLQHGNPKSNYNFVFSEMSCVSIPNILGLFKRIIKGGEKQEQEKNRKGTEDSSRHVSGHQKRGLHFFLLSLDLY